MIARIGNYLPKPVSRAGWSALHGNQRAASGFASLLPCRNGDNGGAMSKSIIDIQVPGFSPDIPPTPVVLGEVVKELMTEVKQMSVEDRVAHIAVVAEAEVSEFDRRILVEGILALLCVDFSFSTFKAFSEHREAFEAARGVGAKVFGRLVATGLDRLSLLGLGEDRNVLHVLHMYSLAERPSVEATASLLSMSNQLVGAIREVPLSKRLVREYMRFLVALQHGDVKRHDPLAARLVSTVFCHVAEGVSLLSLPTPGEVEADAKFADAVSQLGLSQPSAMRQLCRYYSHCLEANRYTKFSQVARIVYSLAISRTDAEELVLDFAQNCMQEDCTWTRKITLRDLVLFNWSCRALQVPMPPRAANSLCKLLSQLVVNGVPIVTAVGRYSVELAQVLPYLPVQIHGLAPLVVKAMRQQGHEARQLGEELGERYPLLRVNELTDAGIVVAGGLVCPQSATLVPWPETFHCHKYKLELLERLGGRPVVLLGMPSRHALLEQRDTPNGLVERQAAMLRKMGWTVAIIPLQAVQQMRRSKRDHRRVCMAAMLEAVDIHLKKREKRAVKSLYYSRKSTND